MEDKQKNFFKNLVNQTGSSSQPEDDATSALSVPETADEEIRPASANSSPPAPLAETAKADQAPTIHRRSSRSSSPSEDSNDSSSEGDSDKEERDVFGEVGEPEGQLTVDVFQTKDEIVIQAPVAGVIADNLDIDISAEAVSIRGHRQRQEKVKEEDFYYQECYWGRFSRSIILPEEINPDKAKAELKDGVLIIRLPKLGRERAKKVKVKVS